MGCSQSASKPVSRPADELNAEAAKATIQAQQTQTDPNVAAANATGVVSPTFTDVSVSPLDTKYVQIDVPAAAAVAPSSTSTSTATSSSRPLAAASLTLNPNATQVAKIVKHRPLVICGPSGVGKGTLLTRLMKEYPHAFAKSVSHTTRQPRAGEVDGVSYHFTTAEELLKAVSENKFVEHANVHGNYYGTSVSSVERVIETGKICLLEIDIQGVLAVQAHPELHPVTLFVRAPIFEDLQNRLTGRGSESAETMQKRLDTARWEMDFFYTNRHKFDDVLVNGEFEESYQQLIAIIQKQYPDMNIKPITDTAAQ